jgi:hypothetical protein
MKHSLLHLLGCALPILLLFLLPALGVGSGVTFTVFIVLMLGCHLFMMGGHSHGPGENENKRTPPAGKRSL